MNVYVRVVNRNHRLAQIAKIENGVQKSAIFKEQEVALNDKAMHFKKLWRNSPCFLQYFKHT